MAFSRTWDATYLTQPLGSDDARFGDDHIRYVKVDIGERMVVDHSWAGTADDGKHKQVTMPEGANPAQIANTGILYTKDVAGKTELFYIDDTGAAIQLTTAGKINPLFANSVITNAMLANAAVALLSGTNTGDQTNGVPVGAIIDFSGTVAPSGYLACPIIATNISRATYAALFAAIGTTWGVGDGTTTFGMPWFASDYAAVQANANVGTNTVGQNLSHTHALADGTAVQSTAVGAAYGSSVTGGNSTSIATSGGAANLAAGVRVLKCVKY